MANRTLRKCPVNAALTDMREKYRGKYSGFEIKEFLEYTGISREDLFYHLRHPNAKWIDHGKRDRIESFFKFRGEGKVIADHENMRMVKAKKS